MKFEPTVDAELERMWAYHKDSYRHFFEAVPSEWLNWAHWRGLQYDELNRKAAGFRAAFETATADMHFSHDWFSDKIWAWHEILEPYRHSKPEILEVGIFEGRSVAFCLEYSPGSRVTAVDHFALKKGWTSDQGVTLTIDSEEAFKRNTARYGDRVELIVDRSWPALSRLIFEGRRYDVIYIDASHTAPDVLADSVLAWRMLKPGGLWIWDDFMLDSGNFGLETVGKGVTTFLDLYEGQYEWVHAGWQVAIRKTGRYGEGMPLD